MKPLLAGLVAGIPLSVVLVLYMLARGRVMAGVLAAEGDFGALGETQLFALFLGAFALLGLGFGLAAGLVYSWLGSRLSFTALALGLALLLSLLALVSRTPLPWDKVFWNFAVAAILGVLIPLLANV